VDYQVLLVISVGLIAFCCLIFHARVHIYSASVNCVLERKYICKNYNVKRPIIVISVSLTSPVLG